jgi:hypothetical protein
MSLGLAYWIILLVAFVFGLAIHFGYAGPYGVWGNNFVLFVLFVLLGWAVFGPPVHR